jgi:hypothetical protein
LRPLFLECLISGMTKTEAAPVHEAGFAMTAEPEYCAAVWAERRFRSRLPSGSPNGGRDGRGRSRARHCVADFNGDGLGDLLWRDSTGDVALWLMSGATAISAVGFGNRCTACRHSCRAFGYGGELDT